MNSDLPATVTAALLELLHPFVPDDFINECWRIATPVGGGESTVRPSFIGSICWVC